MLLLQILLGITCAVALPMLALLVLCGILGGLRRIIKGGTPHFYLTMLQRSLLRNPLRTTLTASALTVLVFVVLAVWSALWTLGQVTEEKAHDLKFIIRAKHYVPSELPLAYIDQLMEECRKLPVEQRPLEHDMMAWQMYVGTVDPAKKTHENYVIAYALEPSRLLTMMDVLEGLTPELEREFREAVAKLQANVRGIILGREKLHMLNKKVGDRFKVSSFNHQGIDLEFEIVGLFPPKQYALNAAMSRDYLNNALSEYERRCGRKHVMVKRTLSLFWVRLPSREAAQMLAARIADPARFSSPALTMETLSSAITLYAQGYSDLIWTLRWLLVPAALVSMSLLAANTVSINTEERATEVGLLKVLGYRPFVIAALIIGEAMLIGAICGAACSTLLYVLVNEFMGGLRPADTTASFTAFFIPVNALWWGPAVGVASALLGSFGPAWSACRVKVAEVFGKLQ